MVSRKLLALAFIKRYIAEHGASPSYGEIAAEVGTNREQVRKIVNRLALDGTIVKGAGHRAISLPGTLDDMIRQLRAAGWTVGVTNPPLPLLAELDDIPGVDVGGLYGNRE